MSDTSTLIAIKYKGQMIEIPEGLTQNDISTFVTSNDVSIYLTDNDISTKLEANDVSQFLTANDVSTDQPFHFFTNTTDSTKKGIIIKNGDGYAGNIGNYALQLGTTSVAAGVMAAAFGHQTNAYGDYSFSSGQGVKVYNNDEAGFGKFNNSSTNTDTLFTVGNGLNPGPSNRHNALEVRLNGDVYIPDTDDTANAIYYKKPMKRLQDLFVLDTSVSQLWDSSMSGGGSADLTDYYTKSLIDTSIANNYASKNDISTFVTNNDISTFITSNDVSLFITSNDVSIYLTDNDISTFITANDISTKLEANDVSLFITSNDVSIYSTNTYVNSTFAKIRYILLSDYDALATKDPSTLYIIPS